MAGEAVARRYARAIFELALERGQSLSEWLADLEAVDAALSEGAVRAALMSPRLSFEKKRDLVGGALQQLDLLRRNFLLLLIERGRVELLGAIRSEFRRLTLEHEGIAEATVTTAVPIDEAEARQIAQGLERLLGKKVVLERRVDPAILGGVVARVGDRLINGSVAARLAALREQLV